VSAVLDPSYPLFAYFVCRRCYFYFYPTLPHLPTKEWSLVFERCTDHANPIRVGASLKTSSSRTMWLCPTQIVNCHQRNFDAAHGFAPFSWTRFAFDGDGHGGWGIVGISDERRTHARVCVCGKGVGKVERKGGAPRAGARYQTTTRTHSSSVRCREIGDFGGSMKTGAGSVYGALGFLFLSGTLAAYGYG
jgi:hypothetical protein